MTETIFTRDSILAALEKTHGEVTAFFQSHGPDVFHRRPSSLAWSYEENLDHLIRAVRPVAMALRLPKFILRLLFGRPERPSRSFEEIKAAYVYEISRGARASGPYLPVSSRAANDNVQSTLVEQWKVVSGRLGAALHGWDDAELDGYYLPHPIVGKITVREMLFFTIYHAMRHMSPEGD